MATLPTAVESVDCASSFRLLKQHMNSGNLVKRYIDSGGFDSEVL